MNLIFYVRGTPRPGGSKTAMPIYGRDGRAVTKQTATGKHRPVLRYVDDGKNGEWRKLVAFCAQRAMRGAGYLDPVDEPLRVEMVFYVLRPAGHLDKAGNVRKAARSVPSVKPDVLKLARSTEDALTGIVWRDDAATVDLVLSKRYASPSSPEGCAIRVVSHNGGELL